jgi:hypothetical protein
MTATKSEQLLASDFVGGILATQPARGHHWIDTHGRTRVDSRLAFNLSILEAFRHLCQLPLGPKIELTFEIILHRIHGDSPTLYDAVATLRADRLIRPGRCGFTIEMDEAEIEAVYRHQPVGRETYEILAQDFNNLFYAPWAERPHLGAAARPSR